MAKRKHSISLKDVFIDSKEPMVLQEIGKEYTNLYNLEKIALEFADKPGVSITFAWNEDIPSEEDI